MHTDYGHFTRSLEERKKDLKEIYYTVSVRALALSMVLLFIPLYLYKELSYGFDQVIYFYIAMMISAIIIMPFVGILISVMGIKRTLVLSTPFYILSLFLLYALNSTNLPYIIPAILYSFGFALFWIPFNVAFAKASDKKSRGKETGIWFALNSIASIIGPLIGASLLTYFGGFLVLFIVASIIFALSSLPLLFTKDSTMPAPFSLSYMISQDHFRDLFAFISYGIRNCTLLVFWPIFVFLLLGTYLSLGEFGTLVGLISVSFALIIGRLSDQIPKERIIKIGALLNSFSWFMRLFVRSFLGLTIFTAIGMFSFMMVEIPLYAKSETRAAKSKPRLVEYIIFKEIWITIGRLLLLLFVLTTFYLLTPYFTESLATHYAILGGVLVAAIAPIAWMFY